ncbi:MAG TPA: hypothetical protein VGD84_16705 [Pseudonocardiaceae bacterium]|jgi:hypothetical protein
MTAPDADHLTDLIADCTDIPAGLRTARPELPLPRLAPAWSVTDACMAQVRELDEYV